MNGVPVATAELKNPLTGQSVEHAIAQYRKDRDPGNRTLRRVGMVHFAVDPFLVAMTTHLVGEQTRFLPFNRGHGLGAGNPPNPGWAWDSVFVGGGVVSGRVVGRFGPFRPCREAVEGFEGPPEGDLPPVSSVGRGPPPGG